MEQKNNNDKEDSDNHIDNRDEYSYDSNDDTNENDYNNHAKYA